MGHIGSRLPIFDSVCAAEPDRALHPRFPILPAPRCQVAQCPSILRGFGSFLVPQPPAPNEPNVPVLKDFGEFRLICEAQLRKTTSDWEVCCSLRRLEPGLRSFRPRPPAVLDRDGSRACPGTATSFMVIIESAGAHVRKISNLRGRTVPDPPGRSPRCALGTQSALFWVDGVVAVNEPPVDSDATVYGRIVAGHSTTSRPISESVGDPRHRVRQRILAVSWEMPNRGPIEHCT